MTKINKKTQGLLEKKLETLRQRYEEEIAGIGGSSSSVVAKPRKKENGRRFLLFTFNNN